MKHYLYIIENIVKPGVYIGITQVSVARRWGCHKGRLRAGKHHSPYFQNAWDKYGEAAFQISEVREYATKEAMCKAEADTITWYRQQGVSVYNIADGGTVGPLGVRQLPEAVERRAAKTRGRKRSPEAIARTALGHKGHRHSEETKRTLREQRIGKRRTEEYKQAHRGYKLKPEVRERIAEANRRKQRTPQWGEHISEAQARRHGYTYTLSAPDGSRHTTNNLAAFARSLGFEPAAFRTVVFQKRQCYRGWRCIDAVKREA